MHTLKYRIAAPAASFAVKIFFIEVMLLFCLLSLAFGDTTQNVSYQTKITDIAPQIILHSVLGGKWDSFDYVNKKPIAIVLIGATPHIETFKDTKATIVTAIAQSVKQMQSEGIEIITVIQAGSTSHNENAKSLEFIDSAKSMNLHYGEGSLYRSFSASPDGITLVAIDKAGFLRRIEKLPVSSGVGAAIIKAAAFQPVLSVSKVAPDFSITLSNEYNWRLVDFRGQKKVLLLFMPKEMTCGCQNPVPSLQAKQAEFDRHDVEVLIISSDEQSTKRLMGSNTTRLNFATDSNNNLRYLYSGIKDQNITDAFAVLIDKNGVVRDINKDSDPENFESEIVDKIINLDSKSKAAEH